MPEDRSVLGRHARSPDDVWTYGDGPDEVVDIYRRSAGGPGAASVALLHGGFWRPEYDRTHLRPMAEALAESGRTTALVEYPRCPGDPDASVDAVSRALGWLGAVLGAPLVVIGHSAGGHLALLAARSSPAVGAVLALGAVADLPLAESLGLDDGAVRDFLGRPAADRPDLDPSALGEPGKPVTLLHGADDSLVPLSLSESYCTRALARLVVLDGVGHFEPLDPPSPACAAVIGELSALGSASGIE